MTTDTNPPPVANDFPAVWPLVIDDMKARDAMGRAKYGTPLQPFNGRKPLQDLYEELLDAVVYTKQELIERADLERRLRDAERDRADLVAALRRFGRHKDRCHGFPATSEEQVARDCDCGFEAALVSRFDGGAGK